MPDASCAFMYTSSVGGAPPRAASSAPTYCSTTVVDSAFELLEERDSAAVLALAAERARATTLATPSRL